MSEKIYIPTVMAIYPNRQPDQTGRPVEVGTIIETPIAGNVSDGYHTFDELYEHRYLLFCLASTINTRRQFHELYCWKSKTHWIDGKLEHCWDGWFVAGIDLRNRADPKAQSKMITYHLPLAYWDLFDGIIREQAPPHDGHTSKDVIIRMKEFLMP